MTSIAIVFHSGYGHTAKQAGRRFGTAPQRGGTTTLHAIDAEGNLPDGTWEALAAGGRMPSSWDRRPTWAACRGSSKSSRTPAASRGSASCLEGQGGGGVHQLGQHQRGQANGTLDYLYHLAMQHSMVWIGTGMMPSNSKAAEPERRELAGIVQRGDGGKPVGQLARGRAAAGRPGDRAAVRRAGCRGYATRVARNCPDGAGGGG